MTLKVEVEVEVEMEMVEDEVKKIVKRWKVLACGNLDWL